MPRLGNLLKEDKKVEEESEDMNASIMSQSEGKMNGLQFHEYYAQNLNSVMDITSTSFRQRGPS